MKIILILFILLTNTNHVMAMEFDQLGGTFTMYGEINDGDSVKFINSLIKWDNPPSIFHISSRGGSLDEAIKIGKIIQASQIPVWSGEECFSACIFIYTSGVERKARGKIGLHRPYFDKKYFANLSSMEAKEKYEELKQFSILYLKEIEVSQSIIDRMFQTGSTDVDIVSATDANILFGIRSPFYDEWLIAKCGQLTDEQSKVLSSWGKLQAARATFEATKNNNIDKTKDFSFDIQTLTEGAQLALQMERTEILKPYIEIFENHQQCENKAINEHIYSFHKSLQKYMSDIK